MKNLKLKGYTNDISKAVWKGNTINQTRVNFCPASRYKECCRERICGVQEPTCTWDKLQYVGKKYGANLTQADEDKIKRKLAAAVKACRPVTVTLTVEKGGR